MQKEFRISSFDRVLYVLFVVLSLSAWGWSQSWNIQPVDIFMPGEGRITGIKYPAGGDLPVVTQSDKALTEELLVEGQNAVLANVIDSPPIAGFVPWIAIAATNKRQYDDLDSTAVASSYILGSHLVSDPTQDYGIGLFDTGAGAHVMGSDNATRLGIGSSLRGDYEIEIQGVTGSIYADVSLPFALYVDGLGAIEPNGTLDLSDMVGEYNVSIGLGKVSTPNLPTALGMPLAVFYTAVFDNENMITVNRYGNEYIAPNITFHDEYSSLVPQYDIVVPLELRPLGAQAVQYAPNLEGIILGDEVQPQTPSIVMGLGSQSLYFVSSVDLYDGERSAIDKNRFMLDTGAQVTVIGSRIGARLGIDPANPDFLVEVEGVNGESLDMPAFYIDKLELPALGEWLTFTNVPVVLLDVSSPEGGTLDGIIGMNLFTEYNMVLRAGGMLLDPDPALELERIIPGSVAGDLNGDNAVDAGDLAVLAGVWLLDNSLPGWNSEYDLAPEAGDGIVNLRDFSVVEGNWLVTN